MKTKPKAVVAMSGGVDSSVAAALMKEDGYDVIGVMMKLWKGAGVNNESGCCSLDAAEDARRVAQVLDLPFYVFNFADQFNDSVVANFTEEYARGRTPNPCVQCNRSVKFQLLLERAKTLGASVLATGHYARVVRNGGKSRLLRGKDPGKDQSYVLYMLNQRELECARFPVGEYNKTEIRQIAGSLALRVAGKPESQEICFVPGGDSHAFLSDQVPQGSRPGALVTASGRRIGTHIGFAHYTVGQRRGLGVGVGMPLYVKEIRPASNEVVVALRDETKANSVQLEGVCLVSEEIGREFRSSVMTRYRGPEAMCNVQVRGDLADVTFEEPQFPPAPGQAAVFYRQDEVLGGGTIQGWS